MLSSPRALGWSGARGDNMPATLLHETAADVEAAVGDLVDDLAFADLVDAVAQNRMTPTRP